MLSSPLTANLLLSYRCNLHCPFCFENSARALHNKELTTEQWCALIDELSKMKVLHIMLTGGEIFFHPGIWEILDHIVRGKMRYKLITNGTLINEDTVKKIKELGHCDSVQLSIDGPEDIHDAIRGKGMFKRTVNALYLLSEAGFNIQVNTVVTRDNYKIMPDFAHFLSSLPIRSYRLNLIHDDDDDCKNEPDYNMLSEEQLAEFISFFYGKFEQFPKLGKHWGAFSHLSYIQHYFPIRDPDGCIKCSNPYHMISIQSDGLVTPCISHRFPIIGYYPQKSIQELWFSKQFDSFRAAVDKGNTLTEERCSGCHYAYYCRRHCPSIPKIFYCLKKLRQHLVNYGITDI